MKNQKNFIGIYEIVAESDCTARSFLNIFEKNVLQKSLQQKNHLVIVYIKNLEMRNLGKDSNLTLIK